MRKLATALLGAVLALGSTAAARAGDIWGIAQTYPDINASAMTVTYTANFAPNEGKLTATSTSLVYKPSPDPSTWTNPVTGASYSLTLLINQTTQTVIQDPADLLTITGNSGGTNFVNSTTPVDVQFTTSGRVGVIFGQGSGTLAPAGKPIVVQIATGLSGTPSFTTSFSAIRSATSDTFAAVPLPDASSLGFVGLALVGGMAYWRKRSSKTID